MPQMSELPRLTDRTYVDVTIRVSSCGTETPKEIVLPDGRIFAVDATSYRHKALGGEVLTVRIGMQTTYLYKESTGLYGPRWFVVMHRACEKVFADAQ